MSTNSKLSQSCLGPDYLRILKSHGFPPCSTCTCPHSSPSASFLQTEETDRYTHIHTDSASCVHTYIAAKDPSFKPMIFKLFYTLKSLLCSSATSWRKILSQLPVSDPSASSTDQDSCGFSAPPLQWSGPHRSSRKNSRHKDHVYPKS